MQAGLWVSPLLSAETQLFRKPLLKEAAFSLCVPMKVMRLVVVLRSTQKPLCVREGDKEAQTEGLLARSICLAFFGACLLSASVCLEFSAKKDRTSWTISVVRSTGPIMMAVKVY